MRTLYLDCGMGAAGDMLTAALTELLPDPEAFLSELNRIGIPDTLTVRETAEKCGIHGTHISVKINGIEEGADSIYANHQSAHSHHRSMADILQITESLRVSDAVKSNIQAIYKLIAEAESAVHDKPVTEIHFHEVGTMDALADITAVCLLMEKLAPQQVIVSPVHVGSGHVRCAHGILPVPAPATAYILKGVPIYGGSIEGELCTPTGAALLKHFATTFGSMPVMCTERIGYGMGQKDFPYANCVRAMLGETEETANTANTVSELKCNIDDMTGEEIGFAMECLFDAGALDVFTVPIGMKKSRPGTMLCVLCEPHKKDSLVKSIFRHTTTLGIRETECRRNVLARSSTVQQTSFGEIRRKESFGYGVRRMKYEYEDLAKAAKEQGISFAELLHKIEAE